MSGERARVALSLPGGGFSGALYQIGALAALEDGIVGVDAQSFDCYVGTSSGASVAAALAGGISVRRLYRALLDPIDNFFPLERSHVLRIDLDEWRRALTTGGLAVREILGRVLSRRASNPTPANLFFLEQIDRFQDSLPAGLFRLDRYERFLAEFFLRRGVPNAFAEMPRPLRIPAHDLDSGERVVFGDPRRRDVPVSLACAASAVLPLFFSPIRIGERHYLDGGLGAVAHFDVAEQHGAELTVVVNPLVPVSTAHRAVPTGHGVRESVRDKGLLWVTNQALRVGAHARLQHEVSRLGPAMRALVLEPEPTDVMLFLHSPVNLDARRAILEYAYKTTAGRLEEWTRRNHALLDRLGWRRAPSTS